MNDNVHKQIYNLNQEEKEYYYSGEEVKLKFIINDRFYTDIKYKYIRNLKFECIIDDYYDLFIIELLTHIENIPLNCYDDTSLKVVLPLENNLKFKNKYFFECEEVIINDIPYIVCRNYTLSEPEK